MRIVALSAVVLSLLGFAGAGHAQQDTRLFFEGDMVRGDQEGAPGPFCVLTNQFQRLQNTATLGANAAAGLGSQGVQAAGNAGNALQAAGEAEARGLTNTGNALNQGLQNYLSYDAFSRYMNPQNTYGTAAPGTPGFSASGNPVMTGYAPSMVPGQVAPGGFTAG